eukprot:5502986-Ditylum_brightwellii.AAC.1
MEASKSKHHCYTGREGVWDDCCYEYKPVAPKRVESVDIDPSVKQIGNCAFRGCKKIKSIIIPDNVQAVGEHAFNGCAALSMVELPSTLKQIKE